MLGKPVIYMSSDLGTAYTINDRVTYGDLSVAPYYFISVNNVDGLWGADISSEAFPNPNLIGETPGDSFRRGKTVTLTGNINARGLAELYEGSRYLQRMFAELADRQLRFTLWNDGFQTYLTGRPTQDLSIVESFDSKKFEWPYTVGIRCKDPRTRKVSDSSIYPTWQV